MSTRKIIHIDMDCFYAAVEMRDRPELRGVPIAVGGLPDERGVIATANYEARAFGVRSAMAAARAIRLCPGLKILAPNFYKYKAESRRIHEIFVRFTRLIEPLSLDEAYLDVSDVTIFSGSATRIAREIRRLIQDETGLTASAGVAPNKFLAKVASEWNKPNGLKVIRPQDVESIVPTLKVEKIFGVGRVTAAKMHRLGLHTCADLQKLSMPELTARFGNWGHRLHDLARGIDTRPVEISEARKSLSVEETFREDLPTLESCLAEIPALYQEWEKRLQRSGLGGRIRGAFVKLKFFDFKTTTHECSFKRMPQISDFSSLLRDVWARRSVPVRLIGIGVRLAGEDDRDGGPQLIFRLQ